MVVNGKGLLWHHPRINAAKYLTYSPSRYGWQLINNNISVLKMHTTLTTGTHCSSLLLIGHHLKQKITKANKGVGLITYVYSYLPRKTQS